MKSQAYSEAGLFRANEDIAVVKQDLGLALVIDGATPLSTNKTELELAHNNLIKFISTLAKNIVTEVSLDPSNVLQNLIKEAGRKVKQDWPLIGIDSPIYHNISPSAALAVARLGKTKAEICILGDCTTVVKGDNHVNVLQTNNIRSLDDNVMKILKVRMNNGESFEEARKNVQKLLEKNRNKRNTSKGYNIADLTCHGYNKMKVFNLHNINSIFLCTDGYEQLINMGICPNFEELNNQVLNGQGIELIDKLRDAEEKDKECKRHIRLKSSDDASFAFLSHS